MRIQHRARLLLFGALLSLSAGCTSEVETGPAPEAADPALIQAALGKADRVDGTEDKVVSNCLTCSLGMEGDAAHASELAGYTLHLCSEHCLARFEGDKEKAVLAVKLPE